MQFQRAFPIITITIGLLLLLYAMLPHGIGLSEDSISYLSAARSLHKTGEMRDIDGNYFVAWAPLYPLMMAALEFLPGKIEYALAGLNLLLFVLTVISSWVLITQALETPFFRVACLAAIVFSFTFMQVYATALSEAVFLLLVNLVALVGTRGTPGTLGTKDYLLLGVLCGAAMLTRYVGVFLLPVVVLSFFVKKEKVVVWKMILFAAIATAPLTMWLARNWMLTGTLTGLRLPGDVLFLKNITVFAETLTSWILPIKIPLAVRFILLAGIVLILGRGWRRSNMRIHFVMVAAYMALLMLAYLLFSFEEPRDRLLAPLFVSFFILVFAGLEDLTRRFPSVPYRAFVALTCLWLAYPAVRIVKHAQLWHNEGVDVYNKLSWNDSETIAWLRKTEFHNEIYSNDAHAVYYYTGQNAVHIPKGFYSRSRYSLAGEGDYFVLWKDRQYDSLEVNRENPPPNSSIEKELDDAIVYRVAGNVIDSKNTLLP